MMQDDFIRKSTVDQIRHRFDNDVERFSNLNIGQEATIDAPLMMELTAQAAVAASPNAERMLDIGCGAGNYTLKILHAKADMNCDLVDLSAPMLKRAAERIAASTCGKVQTFCGDIRHLELPLGAYDLITAAAVLHHLRDSEDWRRVFEKLFSLCAPGGTLWIVDLIRHESEAVQKIMDTRYHRYLESVGGTQYRDKVMAVIDQEDSPQTLPFQLDLLQQVGFTRTEILHKNACYAAFGAYKNF